jgi:pimeloyl-ACP methyl ester carboxylesterase
VDDHLLSDAPTVISAVLAATGATQLHFLGHSMGGMLAVGAISRGLPCAAAMRSVTLVASGCFGAGSWHSYVAVLLTSLARAGVFAGQLVPWLVGLRGLAAPLAMGVRCLFYMPANVDAAVAQRLMRSVLSFIPSGVVKQFLGSLNSPLGIASSDGAWRFAEPKALAHDVRPVFGISGDRDLFCPADGGAGTIRSDGGVRGDLAAAPSTMLADDGRLAACGTTAAPHPCYRPSLPPSVLKTVNLFGGPHRRFLFLGPRYGTAAQHYGHFCPLVGRRAQHEVFPHIEAFLSEFDQPESKWAGTPGAHGAPTPPPAPVPVAVAPAGGAEPQALFP